MRAGIRLGIAIMGFTAAGLGCATTTHSVGYSDAEMELAQRRSEEETLARLSSSNNAEISDAAQTVAHERESPPH
jgi:hypothetical protein